MTTDNDTVQISVTQLYVALFGRAPDAAGLAFCVNRIQDGQSVESVANTMLATEPGQKIFPEGMDSDTIVVAFYRNVLGRDPDAEGLDYWSERLDSIDLGSLISEIIVVVVNYEPDGDSTLELAGQYSRDLLMNRVQAGQYLASLNLTFEQAADLLAQVTDSTESVGLVMAAADTVISPPTPAPAPAPGTITDSIAEPEPAASPVYIDYIGGSESNQITLTSQGEHIRIATGVASNNERLVDFSSMSVGQSVTVAGLKLTAEAPMEAQEVALAFVNRSTSLGHFESSLADWWVKPGYASGSSSVTFVSSTADVLPVSTAGRVETVTVTFKSLLENQLIQLEELSLRATATMTAGQVALAFQDMGSMADWKLVSASTDLAMLTYESKAGLANVDPISISTQGSTEEFDITFTSLLSGQSLTGGGASLTATQDMSVDEVAAAFIDSASDWVVKSGDVVQGQLTFGSTSPDENVIDIVLTPKGVDEVCTVVFNGLSTGQSVTIAGRKVQAIETMLASEVVNDFINDSIEGRSGKSQVTGILTGWDFIGAPDSDTISFRSQRHDEDVPDLSDSVVVAGSNQSAIVTFQPLLMGQSIAVGGKKLTALVDLDAEQVAALFAGVDDNNVGGDASERGTWDGELIGWTVKAGYVSGSELTFESTATLSAVDAISQTGSGERTEVVQVTFPDLVAGQSVTVQGKTLTASSDLRADTVAATFKEWGLDSGAYPGWHIQDSDPTDKILTFVSDDPNMTVTDLSYSVGGRTEESTVTFTPLTMPKQSVTLGKWTLTALAEMSAAEVATDFYIFLTDPAGIQDLPYSKSNKSEFFSSLATAHSMEDRQVKIVSLDDGKLGFVSWIPDQPVPDLPISVSGYGEQACVTFGSLAAGKSVTIAADSEGLDDRTLTAYEDMTAAEVVNAFVVNASLKGEISSQMSGWKVNRGYQDGDTFLYFLSTSIGDVDNLIFSTTDLSSAPDFSVQSIDYIPAPAQPEQSTVDGISSPQDFSVVTTQGIDPPADLSIVTVPFVSAPEDLLFTTIDGVDAPDPPTIVVRQGAAIPDAPDLSVTQGAAAPTDPVVNVTATADIQVDSASSAMSNTYLVVTGFSVDDDRLDLPVKKVLLGSFDDTQTGVAALEITKIENGMVTFGGQAVVDTATLDDLVKAVLTAMSDARMVAAFVISDGQNEDDTYVVVGDGAAGVQASDTLVKLAGIAVNDLNAILV